MKTFIRTSNIKTQRGVTLIIVTIALVALIGFAALAIDISNLYVARNELQNAADAGALAGAANLYRYTPNPKNEIQFADVDNNANKIASEAAKANKSQMSAVDVKDDDIEIGYWNFNNHSFTPNPPLKRINIWYFDPSNDQFVNAIRVTTGRQNPVSTFFARIFNILFFNPTPSAVASIGALGPKEANLPIAICRESIIDPDHNKCDFGIWLDSGENNPNNNTGGWTNFDQQSVVNAASIEPLLEDNCNRRNLNKIIPGNSIETTGSVNDIQNEIQRNFSTIVSCWRKYALDTSNDGVPDTPWEVTLPVIDCSNEKVANSSTPFVVIGQVKLKIVWIAEDKDIENAPKIMNDNPVWESDRAGEERWDDFRKHYLLLDANHNYAPYAKNSIYFGAKSCITFNTSVLVQ